MKTITMVLMLTLFLVIAGVCNSASYLKFSTEYRPSTASRSDHHSATKAFMVTIAGETQRFAPHSHNFFLKNHTQVVGGFQYDADPQLAELLSLMEGRCGYELFGSNRLSQQELYQQIFLKKAALFKRSHDNSGVSPHVYLTRMNIE